MTRDEVSSWALSLFGPWIMEVRFSIDDAYELSSELQSSGILCPILRGSRMRTSSDLYAELQSVLRFPPYFGKSLDAVEDCLTDLSWVPASAYLLIMVEYSLFLADEPEDVRCSAVAVLRAVGQHWAESPERPETWDFRPKPFHVLVQR